MKPFEKLFRCVDPSRIEISGNYRMPEREGSMLQVDIARCTASANKEVKCKSDEEIN